MLYIWVTNLFYTVKFNNKNNLRLTLFVEIDHLFISCKNNLYFWYHYLICFKKLEH